MATSLRNKVALVTGSTSGIGLGVARKLAESGANVMLNGFGDLQGIEKIRASLESDYGVSAQYNGADLSKAEEARALVEDTISKLGSVDILVNNAGLQHVSPIEDFADEKWDLLISVNLSAAFHTIKNSVKNMKSVGWGRIINIASAHGLVASANKAAYVASKHGVVGLTKVVALETAQEKNITCNAICPGWVLTPLVQKQVDEWAKRDGISIKEAEKALLSEKQPALEFVTPEQIGAQVVYLCSDDARLITGSAISMDGGWTAQ